MNLKHKCKTLAAAAAFALSGPAMADILPGTSSTAQWGELFFSVWSPTLNLSYTRDLGITQNNFLAGGATAPVDVAPGAGVDYAPGSVVSYAAGNVLAGGYSLVFGIDSVLASSGLLTAADARWNVVGMRSFGTPDRLFTTSNVVNPTSAAGSGGIVTSVSRIQSWLTATGGVNAVMPGTSTAANDSITAAPPALAYAGSTSFGNNLGGAGGIGFDTTGTVGGTLSFYEFAEGNTRTDYAGGSWLLANDGELSWNAAAPVPIPGALVLLLSGLLGLIGVSRRRSTATAAA